jgi:hypothetical protein
MRTVKQANWRLAAALCCVGATLAAAGNPQVRSQRFIATAVPGPSFSMELRLAALEAKNDELAATVAPLISRA